MRSHRHHSKRSVGTGQEVTVGKVRPKSTIPSGAAGACVACSLSWQVKEHLHPGSFYLMESTKETEGKAWPCRGTLVQPEAGS